MEIQLIYASKRGPCDVNDVGDYHEDDNDNREDSKIDDGYYDNGNGDGDTYTGGTSDMHDNNIGDRYDIYE